MRTRFDTDRLALVMVGLPARGKTHIARRVARYLNWKGIVARVFNVGSYRRERLGANMPHSFFDPDNEEGRSAREAMARAALEDVVDWWNDGGQVAIYDATNITRKRRAFVEKRLESEGAEVVFLESVCTDPSIVDANVRATKIRSPDYRGMNPDDAVEDFRNRIAHYERAYEPLDDTSRYIQTINVGQKLVVNRIRGGLLGGIVNLLMCLHTERRTVFLSRHGQSAYNALGRIGGDTPLTHCGTEYADRLAAYLNERIDPEAQGLEVWTSTLQRTLRTAAGLTWPRVALKALDEIDAGASDGLTYDEIREQDPEGFAARAKDKLGYRYPQGESYLDVVNRLEPVILDIERHRGPLVIIAHQAVLRVLYGYLMNQPLDRIPHLPFPLHTVVELTPIAYGALEERVELIDS